MSRGRLAAAGGVTGALAVLLISLTRAAGGLLSAVAALGGVLPATLTAGTGVVLAGQSSVALGSEEKRARLLAAASCILLFRTPQPAELAALTGNPAPEQGPAGTVAPRGIRSAVVASSPAPATNQAGCFGA